MYLYLIVYTYVQHGGEPLYICLKKKRAKDSSGSEGGEGGGGAYGARAPPFRALYLLVHPLSLRNYIHSLVHPLLPFVINSWIRP